MNQPPVRSFSVGPCPPLPSHLQGTANLNETMCRSPRAVALRPADPISDLELTGKFHYKAVKAMERAYRRCVHQDTLSTDHLQPQALRFRQNIS